MKPRRPRRNPAGLGLQLGQRLGQPVAELDLAPGQRPHQLGLVVAQDAERGAGRDHGHDQSQHARRAGPPVDQVAQEHHPAPVGVRADRVGRSVVAQLGQQSHSSVVAAVDVADDVERAGVVAAVVPQPGPVDRRPVELGRRPASCGPGGTLPGPGPRAMRRSCWCWRRMACAEVRGRGAARCAPGTGLAAGRTRWRWPARPACGPAPPTAGGRLAARWWRRPR